MSLVSNAPVIFFDEPTTGLDPRGRTQMWQTIRGLARNGTTIFLITQYTCKYLLAYYVSVDVYKAISDSTRRAILDELAHRNDQTLFEICARLTSNHGVGSTRQAISQHLQVLEEAGLVRTRREGRYKFHSIDSAPLKQITERWPLPE